MAYIGNSTQNQNYVPAIDYFNGDGSTVAFTLSRPVASVAAVQAVISNVPQNPGSAFTVSGSTITFTSAPPSGTANIYVYYTSPNTQVVQPGQGTVGPTQMSTGAPSWDASGNVTFTGNLTLNNGAADGAQLTLNSLGYSAWNWDNYSGRLRAYYGATEYFTIDSSGNVGIGTNSPGEKLHVYSTSATGVAKFQSSQNYSVIYLTSALNTNGVFVGSDGAGNAYIENKDTAKACAFVTGGSERMRIDSSGGVRIGTTSVVYASEVVAIKATGSNYGLGIETSTGPCIAVNMLGQASGTLVRFDSTGTLRGTISTNGSTVAYNTSSDYRLKENVQPMQNALGVVQQLNPVTYTWKADGSDGQGFIAHELQAVVPDCVSGEKDAVNEDGSILPQGIDTSFLVATLTKAIQELNAKVEAQAAEIAALKGTK